MRKSLIILFLLLFTIFFINTFHEEYPDEYDSIVGGKYILQGKVPYRDWFQHHQPGAYVLSASILPLSGNSFVRFRMILAIVFFFINIGGYFILKKRLKNTPNNLNFYLLYLFAIAVSATYFWWQMNLADNLASYLLIPAYALVIMKTVYRDKFDAKDLLITSLPTFFAWWTSMTYIYIVAGLNLFAVYLYFKSEKITRKSFFSAVKIFATPYLLFLVYLLLTGSLKDYYFACFTYNQNYYVYNAAHAVGQAVNPVRYAITIAMTFFNNYIPALAMVKGFNLASPLIVTLALSNAVFFIYILLSKNYLCLIPFAIMLIYANARSNPLNISDRDYQASVYTMFSFFNGIWTLFILQKFIDAKNSLLSHKVILFPLFFILFVYWFFNIAGMTLIFGQKFYAKYMGEAPLIYDYPQIAQIVNKIASPTDYAWVGPFEFKELFYLKTKIPSRYHWFLQHAAVSKIKDEMIVDFTKNRAKMIVFQRNYSPWGGPAHEFNYFFTDFLDKNYFRLFMLNKTDKQWTYKWKVDNTRNFDLDADFNFDNNRQEEILNELISLGLVEKQKK